MTQTSLPIWQIHLDIVEVLRSGNRLVLVAPTGSGKTTQVPQMLLDAGLAGQKKIIVLQPRRVAARTVAARVAWERNVKLGAEVGYQIRFDDQTGLGTRICYVTEGILLRWFQDDHRLEDVAVILFDEFHERNLLSDVALALVKRLQETERPDLKLAVMSATLEAKPVADYLGTNRSIPILNLNEASSAGRAHCLGHQPTDPRTPTDPPPFVIRHSSFVIHDTSFAQPTPEPASPASPAASPCPILISEGQSFPVELDYLDHHDERPITEQAADVVERIVNSGEPGDILVFMPGMGEINSTLSAARASGIAEPLAFIPLHGDLPPQDQDLAFVPNRLRKVVVATNVAETSVTIDGIRHVVDSGLARIARYDAERGISTLLLEPISRASADQRKGRAGRTAPGTCHRLWTESAHLDRPEANTPEIQRCDLAEVVLLLHSLGIRRAAEFDWLDKPDPQAIERAERLLGTLGALTNQQERVSPASEPRHRGGDGSSPHASILDCSAGGRAVPAPVLDPSSPPAPTTTPPPRGNTERVSSDLTPIGRQMLRLPMHPRYSRMLVEAAKHDCVPAAALCAALVSGRDLLVRLGRDDKNIQEARELFEASQESDFRTLMRAYQFARKSGFNPESCRRYGIHAQTARQIEQTFDQILYLAEQQGLLKAAPRKLSSQSNLPDARRSPGPDQAEPATSKAAPEDPLPRCLMTGFIDQLCVRRHLSSLECELTEGRRATLVRESVVQAASLFVAGAIREVPGRGSENLTLLSLASAVKREWIEAAFPEQISTSLEHLYDRTHKRVACVKLIRFRDLVIHHEHQREVEPHASGRCLAEAFQKAYFELPLLKHDLQQFIARVNLVTEFLPELDFPPFDEAAIKARLTQAFTGLTLAKEAQAAPLREAFLAHLAKEQVAWLDELTPLSLPWPDGGKFKLLYADAARGPDGQVNPPEIQVKLHECFVLKEHPHICEGRLPVRLWLCSPDGKRLEPTSDWPAFKAKIYPKLKPALQRKFPSLPWA